MKSKRPWIAAVPVALALMIWRLAPGFADDAGAMLASGTVEARQARVGSPIAGQIESVAIREGDVVEAGQVLAHFDTSELLARRDQARAQVELARATLEELRNGARPEEVARARAAARAAEERLTDAARDAERGRRLFDGGAISREALDKAMTAVALAESERQSALETLRLVEAGPRPERIRAQRARLAGAEASLAEIEANLSRSTVRAPFAGVVTVRHREPGEVVGSGAPVVTLLDRDERWVRIYVPENRIGAVKLGTRASITSDTWPEKRYPGEVIYIASEAEFTPKSIQTAEERVKLVYAVKVRILDDPGYELKPGMPADVRLELEGA